MTNILDRISCLRGHHKWKFAYNHGIPLGSQLSAGQAIELLDKGTAYQVNECIHCKRQSRIVDGKRIILVRMEEEEP
jgi:hypothetical protein